MISLAEARALIAENISPLRAATAPLAGAFGRVLRENVLATEDLPAFDRSAMDGYAIAADDDSEKFLVVAEIQPGAIKKIQIRRGECARIFTGAKIPAGASQVLMQENVRVEGNFILPLKKNAPRTFAGAARTRARAICFCKPERGSARANWRCWPAWASRGQKFRRRCASRILPRATNWPRRMKN
jgi:molybdopterin biosynthesis enzyme